MGFKNNPYFLSICSVASAPTLLKTTKSTGPFSGLFSHDLSSALKIPLLARINSNGMCYSAHYMQIRVSVVSVFPSRLYALQR